MIKYQSYKRFKTVTGILLIILFILNSFLISGANSPPLIMEGSTAFPINSDHIVLEKEAINIKYGKDKHNVEVVFYFYNTGPETDLQIGFPNVANYGETLYDFKAYQYPDEIEYEVEKKQSGILPGLDQYMYESMYAWTMHFEEGERKALLVTYKFHNTTLSENDYGSAGYILKTGALWKDKIGSIDVYVEFPEKAAYHEITASPSGYFYNGSGIEWHFEDIEPDFDLDIAYHKLPDNLKFDWMYEPKTNMPVSDYIWKDKIFVVDLFERWNLEEEPCFSYFKTEDEIRKETRNLLENCLLAKNEILARHGVKLSDEWYDFFMQFPWYAAQEGFLENTIKDTLNETEKLNLELIQVYQEYIFPDADFKTMCDGLQDLYERFGDAFFRYYPVSDRQENRETIQSFIDKRIECFSEYKPLNSGQANPGYVKSPVILNTVDDINSENARNYGQTENGFPILETTDGRLLIEIDNTYYEIYKKMVPESMYERLREIPSRSALIMCLEFHDFEMRRIIRKWCREVKNPETGEIMNLVDDLLILPEDGEKYVLTGFSSTYGRKNYAWSENYGHLAYLYDMDGSPFLQVFDIENRHLMRYRLPEWGDFQELIVLNDGRGFFRLKDKIFGFLPDDNMLYQYDFKGQIIGFDSVKNSLFYTDQKKIQQYSLVSGHSIVSTLPEKIWKVEKLDLNNYMLYCHPEYYYIFNMPNQKVYRYPQVTGYPNLLKFSPSGCYRLEQFFDSPPVLTKGNTSKPEDSTYEQKELNMPATHRYEWLTDREVVVTEYLNIPESYEGLILEHIYDVEKEEKLLTRSVKKNYSERIKDNIKDGCYFHKGKPVLANALVTNPGAYPSSFYVEKPEFKSGFPVGILEVGSDSSNVVYFNPWNLNYTAYNVDNKYLELVRVPEDLPVGFIADTVVYIDEAKQEILLEKCSAFVLVTEKNEDSAKVKISNALEGWVNIRDLVFGFVSADNARNISLPEDLPDGPDTEPTPELRAEPTETLEAEYDEQDEAMETMKINSGDKKLAGKRVIYIIIMALLFVPVGFGVYFKIRENRKHRKK